jgi:hypothetical protein
MEPGCGDAAQSLGEDAAGGEADHHMDVDTPSDEIGDEPPLVASSSRAVDEVSILRQLDWVRRHERMEELRCAAHDIWLRAIADMGDDELPLGANFANAAPLPGDPPIALPNEPWEQRGAGDRSRGQASG